MEEKLRLTFLANSENDPSIPYRLVIGNLLYIVLSTRLDIAYAVFVILCLTMAGNTAAKSILQYLHKTIDHSIVH